MRKHIGGCQVCFKWGSSKQMTTSFGRPSQTAWRTVCFWNGNFPVTKNFNPCFKCRQYSGALQVSHGIMRPCKCNIYLKRYNALCSYIVTMLVLYKVKFHMVTTTAMANLTLPPCHSCALVLGGHKNNPLHNWTLTPHWQKLTARLLA